MAPMSTQHPEERGRVFAQRVLQAFEAAGRSTDVLIAAASGPSSTTMTKLRKVASGEESLSEPREPTWTKIDNAAEWESGSARRVWRGEEPIPRSPTLVQAGAPAQGDLYTAPIDFMWTSDRGGVVVLELKYVGGSTLEDAEDYLAEILNQHGELRAVGVTASSGRASFSLAARRGESIGRRGREAQDADALAPDPEGPEEGA